MLPRYHDPSRMDGPSGQIRPRCPCHAHDGSGAAAKTRLVARARGRFGHGAGAPGGVGAPFNLGEVTATRCALRLADGSEGHAFVQGRSRDHAARAAQIDALMQGPQADDVRRIVLEPLAALEAERRDTIARKAEATRVNFETLVRGEDA